MPWLSWVLQTFWHSSAHLLGEALELEFGVDLTIGPPIEEGFYYDCSMGDATLNDQDFARVEKRVTAAIKVRSRALTGRHSHSSPPVHGGAIGQLFAAVGISCMVDSTLNRASAVPQEKQRFERVVVTREEALAMFEENKFKIELIQGLPEVRNPP